SKPTVTSTQEVSSEPAKQTRVAPTHGAESAPEPSRETSSSHVLALPASSGAHEPEAQPEAPAMQLASAATLPGLAIPTSRNQPELLKASTLSGGELLHQVQPAYPPT